MRFTLLTLMGVVAYIALVIYSLVDLGRIPVSVLFTVSLILLLVGLTFSLNSRGARRAFFVTYTSTSFLVMFLLGGYPPREFYSLPAVSVEWANGAGDFYGEWGYAENIPFANDGRSSISKWRLDEYLRKACRRRVRFVVNTACSVIFGCVFGMLGHYLQSKSSPTVED